MINVLVADSHTLFREGLKKLLGDEKEIKITAEANDSNEVIKLLNKNNINVVLLELLLPGKNWLRFIEDIRTLNKKAHVLVLTSQSEEGFAERTYRSGASGFLTKNVTVGDLVNAIKKVASGQTYLSQHLAEKLANELSDDVEKPLFKKLTDAEFQILLLIAEGKKISEIAKELDFSIATINTYRTRMLKTLKLNSNIELTHYAIQNGLVYVK